MVLGVIVVWIVVWSMTKGNDTLELPGRQHTDLHDTLTDFRDSVLASRDTNPVIAAHDQHRRRLPQQLRLAAADGLACPTSRGRCRRSAGSA